MAVRDASAMCKRLRPLRDRSDSASTETLGTALIIGVMVTVAATLVANPQEAVVPEAPAATIGAQALVGSTSLLLTHEGGGSIGLASRLVVSQTGLTLYDGPLEPGGGMWFPGETLRVDLVLPISATAPVETTLTVAGSDGGATIPVYPAITDPNASSGAGITAQFLAPTAPVPRSGTDALLLVVYADHPGGRKLILNVEARLTGLAIPPVNLQDDGTNGDLVARDGQYSGYATLPLETRAGTYNVTATVTALDGQNATATSLVLIDDLWAQTTGAPPEGTNGTSPPGDPTPPNGPVPPPPSVAPPTPFTIQPTGGIRPSCVGELRTTVLGVALTYGAGGPPIPVKLDLTRTNGANYTAFADGTAVGTNTTSTQPTGPTDVWGARGKLAGFGLTTSYTSVTGDPHVVVLTNGSYVPNVTAFGDQSSIVSFLGPYVSNGRAVLLYHQAILLYEFTADLSSRAADYQDLVVLLDIICPNEVPPGAATPASSRPSGVDPFIALVSQTTALTCRQLQASEVWHELTVQPARAGTFTDGAMTVTVSNWTGTTFDWASSHALDGIAVHGGAAGSHFYRYVPDSAGGSGLRAPGTATPISTISFCYDLS